MKELAETGPKVLIQHNGDASNSFQSTIQHKEVSKTNLANEKVNDVFTFLF